MQVERYRIILTGWVVSGFQTRDVIAELSRLFKIPEDQVRPLLVGDPSIIRRDLSLEKAEYLRNKIEQRGAVCNIKLIMRDEYADSAYSIDNTGILEPDLNIDSTQFMPLTADPFPPVKKATASPPVHPFPSEKKTTIATSGRSRGGGVGGRKGRRVVPIVLFAGVMVAALVWGYLYLDRHSSDLTPKIFTLSPAKGVGTTEGERKAVRP
jgi:hypothetical protein